jgi:predicted methyltransferase
LTTDDNVRYLVEGDEETLVIGQGQAMQRWEAELMEYSADLMCSNGTEFLEVGLGFGFSALRIARRAGTRSHVVIEKFPEVIKAFDNQHPDRPASLEIRLGDIFDVVDDLAPTSFDGIFFDPALRMSVWEDEALWADFAPRLVRCLRPEGVLVPFFTTRPVLRPQFAGLFHEVHVYRRPYEAYASTIYTYGRRGDAFVQVYRRPDPTRVG